MLRRQDRIPRKDFPSILSSRRFAGSSHFSLRVGEIGSSAKVAVSVSKKVAKSAVARNAIRRRAYGAIYPYLPSLRPGLYLFSAKAGAQGVKGQELAQEIEHILKEFHKDQTKVRIES